MMMICCFNLCLFQFDLVADNTRARATPERTRFSIRNVSFKRLCERMVQIKYVTASDYVLCILKCSFLQTAKGKYLDKRTGHKRTENINIIDKKVFTIYYICQILYNHTIEYKKICFCFMYLYGVKMLVTNQSI